MSGVRCKECGCTGFGIADINHNINCPHKDGYGTAGDATQPIGASGGSPELHGRMYQDANNNH